MLVKTTKDEGDDGLFHFSAESDLFYFLIRNLTTEKTREIFEWMSCIPSLLADSVRNGDSDSRRLFLWKINGAIKRESICTDLMEFVEENYGHEIDIFRKLKVVNQAFSMLKMVAETELPVGCHNRHCVLDEKLSFLFISSVLGS